MTTLTINTNNETLANMTDNITKAQTIRANTVQSIIRDTLDYANDHKEVFSTKKNAISVFIKQHLNSNVDTYTKRALKVAKLILIDGYKVKRELLTLAQIENLLTFNKNTVNKLMQFDGDMYIDEVKELIKSAKIEKTTKVFSAKKAKDI